MDSVHTCEQPSWNSPNNINLCTSTCQQMQFNRSAQHCTKYTGTDQPPHQTVNLMVNQLKPLT
jgi:hypothetical protein